MNAMQTEKLKMTRTTIIDNKRSLRSPGTSELHPFTADSRPGIQKLKSVWGRIWRSEFRRRQHTPDIWVSLFFEGFINYREELKT